MKDTQREMGGHHWDWHNVDARIFGQLLAAQNVLFVLPDEKRISEYFSQALSKIPGVTLCYVCLGDLPAPAGVHDDVCVECASLRRHEGGTLEMSPGFPCRLADKKNLRAVNVRTQDHHFGFFILRSREKGDIEPYLPFVENLANFVALSLENRLQRQLLERSRDDLEDTVMVRTEELRRMNERFSLAAVAARLGVWDWDLRNNIMTCDNGMYALFGRKPQSRSTTYEWWLHEIHPDDRVHTNEMVSLALGCERELDVEFRVIWPDGSIHFLKGYAIVTSDADGKPTRMTGINIEITERRRAEESIKASLREKDALLKEIHHRVKNNLQVVCSLLSLQSQNAASNETQDFFHETEARIRSMAMVHEKLYTSGDMASIDFGEYLKELAHHIMSGFKQKRFACSVQSDRVMLGIDVAVPCGLIANELIDNAFRHGFKGRDEGTVLISIRRLDSQTAELSVHDNGIGFFPTDDLHKMTSMGMTLVNSLTEQISGTTVVRRDGGTTFVITFPA